MFQHKTKKKKKKGKIRTYLWFIICLNIYYIFGKILNIVSSNPGDILHTDLIKVTILPSIPFKKSICSI